MPPWSYALLFLVAMMAVALVADRLVERRDAPRPVPVRARRRPTEPGRHRG